MQRYPFASSQRATSLVAVSFFTGDEGAHVFLSTENEDKGILLVRGDDGSLSAEEWYLDDGVLTQGAVSTYEFAGNYSLVLFYGDGFLVLNSTGATIDPTVEGTFTRVAVSEISSIVVGGVALLYEGEYLTHPSAPYKTTIKDLRVYLDPGDRISSFPVAINSGKYFGPERYRS